MHNNDTTAQTFHVIRMALAYQNEMLNTLKNINTSQKEKLDPINILETITHSWQELLNHPEELMDAGFRLTKDYVKIWENIVQRHLQHENVAPAYGAEQKDNRFKDAAWETQPALDFIKQAYHMQSTWLQGLLQQIHSLDKKEKHKLEFYSKQLIDALAPSNFPMLNPEVIKEAINSKGASLQHGFENFLADVKNSAKGTFSIKSYDASAFKVGENLAVSSGKVVFENSLFQLIQYAPSTEQVHSVPLIIMPAWINKYYILDLQQKNSFVKWIIDQGITVFMISWVNPTAELANKTFVDYMQEGALTAVQKVQKITGSPQVNMLGYCLGGTLLATLLAFLAKKEKKMSIKSATFLTALVDFVECGDVGVFIDEKQISALEKRMNTVGYLDAAAMRQTFSMLRANDMIWSFYVNNYLLGKAPMTFDILYWNADSTCLPAAMHSYYLRNMYQHNLLIQPNGLTIDNIGIDLRNIDVPSYLLATKEDHIAPWRSVYKAMDLYRGSKRFVLSASGHVAGVVNHPERQKYCYWTNEAAQLTADEWLKGAKETAGSWWLDWGKWLAEQSGEKIAKRTIKKEDIIEDAPGRYVQKRAVW